MVLHSVIHNPQPLDIALRNVILNLQLPEKDIFLHSKIQPHRHDHPLAMANPSVTQAPQLLPLALALHQEPTALLSKILYPLMTVRSLEIQASPSP